MRGWSKHSKRPKGVAILFFLLVFGLMLGFMMLVINSGMIVYQKIRLQTAVDLASYAGAAVQASYLGNEASGKDSISGINFEIQKRYVALTQEMMDLNKTPMPWPGAIPIEIPGPGGRAACMVACAAANMANAQLRVNAYKRAAQDMDQYRIKAAAILSQLPAASKKAAEATIRLNIPELSVASDGVAGDFLSETTDKVDEIIQSGKNASSLFSKKKNAVLSFSSQKGMYLASVVASVPHSFAYYGPGCSNYKLTTTSPPVPTGWYCLVNGQGAGGFINGYTAAAAALGRSVAPPKISGNIGTIDKITDKASNAIRLHFIQNTNKPDPFFVSAAEWYPKNGAFMNMENSFGATGSLFPKQTRLVAVSAAEPFGGSLIGDAARVFGVRLTAIRKVLLDPRMLAVKNDYPGVMDYMESLGPMDQMGRPIEKSEDVIRRFLH